MVCGLKKSGVEDREEIWEREQDLTVEKLDTVEMLDRISDEVSSKDGMGRGEREIWDLEKEFTYRFRVGILVGTL